jgi:hypothetical protein
MLILSRLEEEGAEDRGDLDVGAGVVLVLLAFMVDGGAMLDAVAALAVLIGMVLVDGTK